MPRRWWLGAQATQVSEFVDVFLTHHDTNTRSCSRGTDVIILITHFASAARRSVGAAAHGSAYVPACMRGFSSHGQQLNCIHCFKLALATLAIRTPTHSVTHLHVAIRSMLAYIPRAQPFVVLYVAGVGDLFLAQDTGRARWAALLRCVCGQPPMPRI